MSANFGFSGPTRAKAQKPVPGVAPVSVQTSMPITPEEAAAIARFTEDDFGTGFDVSDFAPGQAAALSAEPDIIYRGVQSPVAGSGAPVPAEVVESPANVLQPVDVDLPEYSAVPASEVSPQQPAETVIATEVPEGTLSPAEAVPSGPGANDAQGATEEDLFLQSVPGISLQPMPSELPYAKTPEEAEAVVRFMDDGEGGFDGPDITQPGIPALAATPDIMMETVSPPVAAPPAEEELPYMPLDEMFSQAWDNIGPSAWNAGSDLLAPLLDPVGTYNAATGLISGVYQKFQDGEHADEKYADAFGQFMKDRYGSWEAAKRTFAKDPVGFASDVSIILTGGGAAAAKVPAAIAKAGRIANKGGRALEGASVPASIGKAGGAAAKAGQAIEAAKLPSIVGDVGRAVNAVGRGIDPFRFAGTGIAAMAGGVTGGGKSLQLAARAGNRGGAEANAFQTHLRGKVNPADLVNEAKTVVSKERSRLGEASRRLKAAHLRDELDGTRTPLDFTSIEKSVSDIPVEKFRGRVLDDNVADVQRKLAKEVADWRVLDPNEFHTVTGVDAFRQRIAKIRDRLPEGSKERVAADKIYGAALRQIETQAPDFAKAIRQFDKDSKHVGEIERILKIEPDRLTDESAARLEALLKFVPEEGVAKAAEPLIKNGPEHFMTKLAGQSLSGPLPWETGAMGDLAGLGSLSATDLVNFIPAAVSAARRSPRLAGEAAYYTIFSNPALATS